MGPSNVFMIGWEYPPHNSGGLGVACAGLTQALAKTGYKIYFTLPYQHPTAAPHMEMVGCYNPSWFEETKTNQPPFDTYHTPEQKIPTDWTNQTQLRSLPQSEIEQRVSQYGQYVFDAAKQRKERYQIVHAHDWMSFPAAERIQKKLKKRFIAHVHATEWDRTPNGHGSPYIAHIEYQGLQAADKVVAVSHYTKQVLVTKYQVDPQKIEVVHNGIDPIPEPNRLASFAPDRPVVAFMGRLTSQKGTEYFIDMAKYVLAELPNTLFILAGNGDQYESLLLKAAHQQLSAAVLFSGFLRGTSRNQLLQRADVFVMPSVSEPFGLVALEAAQYDTPVIVSSTSGVKEVLLGSPHIDFWDARKMSSLVIELLTLPEHRQTVVDHQHQQLKHLTWDKAANKINALYTKL